MNPSLQRQHVMQKQMLEHQARVVASRQRDMLGAAWFDAQAREAGMQRLRRGAAAQPAKVAKRGWPATRLLFWLMAAVVAARLLTSL
jgi:hypothetical protein